MIRNFGCVLHGGVLAMVCWGSPVLSQEPMLGDVGNMGRILFEEGHLDFSVAPFPVAYDFSVDRNFLVAPTATIAESYADSKRSASIDVSQGIVKIAAASKDITGDSYVHAAWGFGGFVDTFSVNTSDPGDEWVAITVKLFLDGAIDTPGGVNEYNRGAFQGAFELVTAPGGQQDGKWQIDYDFERGGIGTVEQGCVFTPGQQSCGFVDLVGYDSSQTIGLREFTYHAVVKANQQFTLASSVGAGAASLAEGEWSGIDFSHTAIFGGIEVGEGFSVTSAGAGGLLNIQNGVANYDAAFAALVDKYGSATPGIPEPASWAMMVAGFALLGGLIRKGGKARAAIAFA